MENLTKIHIYVSANGNDAAEGTKEAPLATLEGAKNYLRKLECAGGATVTFLEGVYKFEDSVIFNEEDSGCDDNPVIYEAEGDVVFSGGESICHCKLGNVKDEAMAKRIPCVDNVKALDISHLNLDPTKFFGALEKTPRFYAGEQFYETARFPNREKVAGRNGPYLKSETVFAQAKNNGNNVSELHIFYDEPEMKEHISKWSKEVYDESFIYGYFWHQWYYNRYKPYEGDAENGIIKATISKGAWEKLGETKNIQRRSFITNLPEELDDKGEYYYDRKTGILYFIPYDDFTDDTQMVVSILEKPAVLIDGAENITFKNIKFRYYVNEAIHVNNAQGIVFDGCEISHTTNKGALVTKTTNCKFISCDIFDLGCGGITFRDCGDRYNLIQSGNEVRNCIIHDFSQILTVYNPAVECFDTCGLLIKENTMSRAQHQLIMLTHVNDVIIEDNIFSEAVRDTDDAAAIYWDIDPTDIGIIIRNNYFENIGNKEGTYLLAAIYIDDWATGADIYNNVFYNCGMLSETRMDQHTNANSIVLNNAQFVNAHNNIMVGTYKDQKPINLYACPSYIIWMTRVYDVRGDRWEPDNWYDKVKDVGFLTEKWKEHYRNTIWANMWDYVTEDIHNRIEEYKAAHAHESIKKIKTDLTWMIFDEAWDHKTEEGEDYNGTFFEYYKERYGEELKEHFENYENNTPSWQTAIADHIFWKIVYHKIFVRTTNTFRNNLSVGMDRDYLREDEHLKGKVMNGFYENYLPATDKLKNGESMFIDYDNRNFELTPAGIKEVHKHIPEFHNINVNNAAAKR